MGEEIDEGWLDRALRMYADDRSNSALRDSIQEHADWMAVRMARRFADMGEPFDDLVQVARLGLFKSIERYDPTLGVPFGGFATPTILGELRRHFRDHTWSAYVPRRAKDLRPMVNDCVEMLTSQLGRAPRIEEISGHLRISSESVVEVLEANQGYRAQSLDPWRTSQLADRDGAYDDVLDKELVAGLLDRLPERERKVLYLRFYEEMSQARIAEHIGTSQVHVGRILAASLARLRSLVEHDHG